MIVVVISQMLGGLGLSAGITVGALIAKDLLGTDQMAGLPIAIFTLGSALAAFLIGRVTKVKGRRVGLSFGYIIGGIGGIGVIYSTASANIPLLFISLFLYGSGTATNLFVRYAGTDIALPGKSAQSVGIAMMATTFGAIIGPNLSSTTSKLADSLNLPILTGQFILASFAFLFAGIILLIFLKPDPFFVAKYIEKHTTISVNEEQSVIQTNKKAILFGGTVLVVSQLLMIGVMTMTPVHIQHGGHGLSASGIVIAVHVAGMYLPSMLTGTLIEKFGANRVALLSGITLLLAAIIGFVAPVNSIFLLSIALFLLGLGWNFGLISGTDIVIQATNLNERPATQGKVDIFVAISGAFGGYISGVIVDSSSFGMLNVIAGIISIILILVIWNFSRKLSKTK
ncbi:MFS transporter [Oceanobacillus neutriphilus]|nr:MFS transporter [Oceanobacillus neutriphilus]